MEVKALHILQKDIVEYDDFFLSCEAFIGPKGEPLTYDVYSFNVIIANDKNNSTIKNIKNVIEHSGFSIERTLHQQLILENQANRRKCCECSHGE